MKEGIRYADGSCGEAILQRTKEVLLEMKTWGKGVNPFLKPVSPLMMMILATYLNDSLLNNVMMKSNR